MSENYQSREERRKKQAPQKNKTKRKAKRKKSFLKTMMYICSLLMLLVIAIGIFFAINVIRKAPALDEALLKDPLSSIILDVNGKKIAELGEEKREKITYDQIPKTLENAVIAIEDIRFFEHNGIDVRRIAGSVLANIKEGRKAQGGSTITQQVVKRSFLSPEKTYTRKFQEWYLSLKLEQKYSKEQILEMYLNKIFYGENAYGVQRAAKTYFGKDVSKLNLSESALLAGIPNLPTAYNPFENPDAAKKRRDLVLSEMHENGFITEKEMKDAQAIKIEDMLTKRKKSSSIKYQAFVDIVLDEVEKLEDVKLSDGVIIHTTIDPTIQERVELLLSDNSPIRFPSDKFEAGISVVDPETGAIRAIGGGRNKENVFRGFNYASDLRRQPGSTFKPIADYAPAIEDLNWSTYQLIKDEPYSYSNGASIKNADGGYKGTMTMREALVWSRNITALKTLQEVGIENAQKFVESLGFSFKAQKKEMYESDSIGGSLEVSPLQMSAAYAAFANGGEYNTPHAITKIEYQDGQVKNMETKSKKVMKDSTAYMITDMLRDVVDRGTGTLANVWNLDLAGKTGTTNYDADTIARFGYPSSATKDSWMAGYTPNLAVAVWTGYPQNGKGMYLTAEDQRIAKYLFKDIMANAKQDNSTFKKPNSVVELPIVKGSNPAKIAPSGMPSAFVTNELFVRGSEPSDTGQSMNISIAAPSNLKATATTNPLQYALNWTYPEDVFVNSQLDEDMKEELLKDGVTFEVTYKASPSGKSNVINTKDLNAMITLPEGTKSVTVSVVAKLGAGSNISSSPASLTITLPDTTIPEEPTIPPDDGSDGDGDGGNEGGDTDNPGDDGENPDDTGGESNNQGGQGNNGNGNTGGNNNGNGNSSNR